MAQKNNSKNVSVGGAVGFAAGLAALAAGGYFIFGPQGAKNRKAIKGWTLKAKGEVLEKIEKLKEVTPEVYNKVIDDVTAKYAKVKGVDTSEIESIVQDARKYWKAMAGATKKKAVKKVTSVKKTVKAVKKALSK